MSVRFAPSPTGRFHIGNLRTAMAAWLWSQKLALPLVVRFEDIDRPRVVTGARETQTQDLASLGIIPHRVELQSENHNTHYSIFLKAMEDRTVYPCFCSRKDLSMTLSDIASAPHSPSSGTYSGACRDLTNDLQQEKERQMQKGRSLGWRFRMDNKDGSRDFLVARTQSLKFKSEEFMPGYHWACALDDIRGEHQLLVRAWDLQDAIDPQRQIQRWYLDLQEKQQIFPAVFHTALVVQENGMRLEKRTKGVTLQDLDAGLLKIELEMSLSIEPRDFQMGRIWGESMQTLPIHRLLNSTGADFA